jgi:hypothetical protein
MNDHTDSSRTSLARRTLRLSRALAGVALLLSACADSSEKAREQPITAAKSRTPWTDLARNLGLPANASQREMAARLTERVASTQKQLKERTRTAQPEIERVNQDTRVGRSDPLPRRLPVLRPMRRSESELPSIHITKP